MTQSTQSASEGSLAQEAIFVASSKIAQVLTFHWDENSVDDTVALSTAKIVEVAAGNSAYNRIGTTTFRAGSMQQDRHRKFHDNSIATRAIQGLGVDTAAADTLDIDDEVTTNLSLNNAGIGSLSYKQNYTMDVAVGYISDATAPANGMNFNFSDSISSTASNLKIVQLSINRQLSDSSWELVTRLRAYSANIGEVDYQSRIY